MSIRKKNLITKFNKKAKLNTSSQNYEKAQKE